MAEESSNTSEEIEDNCIFCSIANGHDKEAKVMIKVHKVFVVVVAFIHVLVQPSFPFRCVEDSVLTILCPLCFICFILSCVARQDIKPVHMKNSNTSYLYSA